MNLADALGLLLQCLAASAAEGEQAIVGDVDLSSVGPISARLRWIYDEFRFFYALLAVVMMVGAGVLLGVLTEVFLSMIGMGTERLNHAE